MQLENQNVYKQLKNLDPDTTFTKQLSYNTTLVNYSSWRAGIDF